MSMLDSFFSKGFKAAKCKTLLKLTIPRIKLLRNRREIQIKQMRKDIAKLLETGQEATARIRVEHIIREENMMAAQEILELFCELISVRLPIIEIQRECPLDLKEAISSVCFAAPRCADLQELLQVQMLFATKYGKEFVAAATELRPDCGVNRQIIELLSVRAPAPETKLKLLKEIAEEHQLDWDPSASETEFLKQPEDLLNGPAQFMSGSQLPLPKEKHEEPPSSVHNQDPCDQSDSDSCFDGLDFPEVPKVSLRPSGNQTSPPQVTHPETETAHPEADDESFKHAGVSSNLQHEPDLEYKEMDKERIVGQAEIKQFLPFIAPSSVVSSGFPATAADLSSYQQTSEHEDIREEDVLSAAQAAADSAECCPHLAALATPANLSASQLWTTSEDRLDLQDVLAAAQVAADSAERAATAARSAASLVQLRINELVKRKNENVYESTQVNPFHQELADEADGMEKQHLNHEDLKAHISPHTQDAVDPENHYMPESSIPATETANVRYDSFTNDHSHHQPQRLPSMDDDPYFSYPNLFTPQGSEHGPGSHSFTGKSSG